MSFLKHLTPTILANKISTSIKQIGQKASQLIHKIIPDGNISTTAKFYAQFALQAYEKRKNIGDFVYHPELSVEKRSVHINENKKEIVVSERGTEVSDIGDVIDDAKILGGIPETIARIPTETKFILQLIKDYPEYEIHLTGHSLGGSCVLQLLLKIGQLDNIEQAYIFNAGVAKPIQSDIFRKKLQIYHIIGDAISVMGRQIKARLNKSYRPRKLSNPHSVFQFL